jgi:DNA (cytosine-5)-methyltransferase 1
MPEAVATRAAAGFKTHEVGDVWEFDFASARGEYDGLIASPPCQTFSTAGKGAGRKALDDVLYLVRTGAWKSLDFLRNGHVLGDERTALVLTPLHAAWEMRPEWLAWEQVPTVLPVWEACAEELRSWGYSVWTGNLQAEQYGVPQTRKRAFLIAHREREVVPPAPTHSRYYSRSPEKLDPGVQKWVSMAEALLFSEIVDPHSGDETPIGLRSNYGTGGDPAKRGERELVEPAGTVTSKIDRNKWIYVRPGTTVNADPRISKPGRHDPNVSGSQQKDAIRVTVQEAGVLQSFPADFPWQGSKTKQYLQCGNAVPPLLAEAVLRSVL